MGDSDTLPPNYLHTFNRTSYAHEYFASDAATIHLLNRVSCFLRVVLNMPWKQLNGKLITGSDFIKQEMKQVLRTKKVSAPLTTVVRGYEYYTKTSRHGMVYCRRRKAPMAREVTTISFVNGAQGDKAVRS